MSQWGRQRAGPVTSSPPTLPQPPSSLDFHQLTLDQSVHLFRTTLTKIHAHYLRPITSKTPRYLTLIVGKGKKSQGGPVLKPYFVRMCQEKGAKFRSVGDGGAIVVDCWDFFRNSSQEERREEGKGGVYVRNREDVELQAGLKNDFIKAPQEYLHSPDNMKKFPPLKKMVQSTRKSMIPKGKPAKHYEEEIDDGSGYWDIVLEADISIAKFLSEMEMEQEPEGDESKISRVITGEWKDEKDDENKGKEDDDEEFLRAVRESEREHQRLLVSSGSFDKDELNRVIKMSETEAKLNEIWEKELSKRRFEVEGGERLSNSKILRKTSDSVGTSDSEEEEEDMRRAIHLSKREIVSARGDSEDEDIDKAIILSEREIARGDSEDEDIDKAIILSEREMSRENLSSREENVVVGQCDDELRKALELSLRDF